ncbi:MAG: trehalose-6-phosphate synthase [Rhodospirillaceae bacterium]|nr:trehalose-6-phosphate synthase [Rhodospirillaceae bacterium]
MQRLIVVSNRLPGNKAEVQDSGVAATLISALEDSAGLWIAGAEDPDRPITADTPDQEATYGRVCVGLTAEQIAGHAFLAEHALAPVLYGRLDLAQFDEASYLAYRRVNVRFADTVARYAAISDSVLVYDHHQIPLARELRRQGYTLPIGFFLREPFPDPEIFGALPWACDLAEDLSCYDLVGFQTGECQANFQSFVEQHCGGNAAGDRLSIDGSSVAVGAFPTGIDARRAQTIANSSAVDALVRRIRAVLHGQTAIVGLERLDEMSGILRSFSALETLFEQTPELAERICLLQVMGATPRPDLRAAAGELKAMSDCINGCFGSDEWKPVHLANRAFSRAEKFALLRASRIGLMARPRAGMGLAAKEYIAAQDPEDPGVLVLSQFAGAASELTDAVLVDPLDDRSIAEGLRRATEMPQAERQGRWLSMMRKVQGNDAQRWGQRLLAAVHSAHRTNPSEAFVARRRAH